MNRKAPHALPWLLLSAVVMVADQWTKHIALRHLSPYDPQPVIPGLLNWTLAFNPGAAFSFLAGAGGWQRWFFTALAMLVSAVIVVWLARTPRHDWRTALPLALVVGGAVGNVIDRIRFGQVTDFIQVYYQQWAWPAFNIADAAISVGAVLLIIGSFRSGDAAADMR